MKISYMLKREDFYAINRRTLDKYYADAEGYTKMYVYPKLNAIITAHPSRQVRQYLYTEYHVNASAPKKMAVSAYTHLMLNSFGVFSRNTVTVPAAVGDDTLIYPCNRKYRIFHFLEKGVDVIVKDGFPTWDIAREIEFRTTHFADFIPTITAVFEHGYTEKIIDGYPLARAGDRMGALSDAAMYLWREYIQPTMRQATYAEYAQQLLLHICDTACSLQTLKQQMDFTAVTELAKRISRRLAEESGSLEIVLSHGDLQPGNIWIENGSDRIIIIDWESWGLRSAWYDEAVLYHDIRRLDGLIRYLECRPDSQRLTVALEDLIFRLNELNSLPMDYGSDSFNTFFLRMKGYFKDV